MVLALTSLCIVDEVPDFELTVYKCEDSTIDSNTVNERKAFPHANIALIQNQGGQKSGACKREHQQTSS